MQWVLRRNCSLTPRQVATSFAAVAGFTLALGAVFSWMGYPLVMAFVLLEITALAAALLAYARCAGDRDILSIEGEQLVVEQWHAARVQRTVLPVAWVRVSPAEAPAVGLQLAAGGVSVAVGRHVTPRQRERLLQELRQVLRGRALAGSFEVGRSGVVQEGRLIPLP
ncbi:DUF2244 domain-containing protein [Aquincola sp. J276]|uniref:DUF2244 domain-containing protein n=1 Tax=Aquincola sp. J276 TaxID=2898432 RepID=UPI002150B2B0|nr:DUF2244 domain-containing protein [Aquincola sp. J276]MCR5867544.1 DUF2244 domain-containing protein [Aquincola sp. J276]